MSEPTDRDRIEEFNTGEWDRESTADEVAEAIVIEQVLEASRLSRENDLLLFDAFRKAGVLCPKR